MEDAEFSAFVRAHQRAIRAYVGALGVPWDAVDDVAHDAFVRYYLDRERRPAHVEPVRWLKGIARNAALDWLRSRARSGRWRALAEAIEAAGDGGHEPVDELLDAPALDALRVCLTTLPTPGRQVLDWFYRDELGSAAIASKLGQSDIAVRQRLVRLREALADCIRKRLGGARA